jgi:type II pantothenate kinase
VNISIDLGGSTSVALRLNPFEAKLKPSENPQRDLNYLLSFFPEARKIAVTGGGSNKLTHPNSVKVDEIVAIGRGGLYLSELKKAVVVSVGTGTAVVNAAEKMQHLGGTAVGGGTLTGLGKLILGISNPLELEELAKKGNADNVDLTVGDICGGPVGIIPADATASNFAKVTQSSKPEDIAASLHRMIGQTIGLIANFTSDGKNLVFIGQPTKNRLLRKEIQTTLDLFDKQAIFPKKAEWGTAIGAYVHVFGD